ncbi:MAG: [FeFe] hydrogenase H-cluster maturation GTPase HydF [Oscillospiraceae bacterium]|nr:[FeFe] hydrogenase H-cluster maturation GTPase HydF [Oscillospiraceae bacterium]
MNLNDTPSANRIHIGIFGKRNVGKSSIINAITKQDIAIVSDIKGTTTDPVYKAMEILPIGPITLIDTPGLDDEGELGLKRIKKSFEILNKSDIAIIVIDAKKALDHYEFEVIDRCKNKNIPFILAINKTDCCKAITAKSSLPVDCVAIEVSAKTEKNIDKLKELIASFKNQDAKRHPLVFDLISKSDTIILVTPIDSSAPKGRLILPVQQVTRDILDSNAIAIICQENELEKTICSLKEKPDLVITDSQIFEEVGKTISDDIPLTSFSILFARHNGILDIAIKGAQAIKKLTPSDKVLISEGCTHHRQCDDIGTIKLPRWITSYLGFKPQFEFTSGFSFPEDLSLYKLVVHCGGCMLTPREVQRRFKECELKNIPITNYGVLIASLKGMLDRSTKVFYCKK